MFSLTGFNLRFTPSWKMSILALCSLLFLTYLGCWQLQRANEKKQMVAAHDALTQKSIVNWSFQASLPLQYERIRVQGQFLPHVILLDNQHYQHRFGYQVLSLLRLNNGHLVVVDRGFVEGDISRQQLPEIDTPKGVISVEGSVYYPSSRTWLLGNVFEKKQANTLVIEQVNMKFLRHFLHKSVYPFMIRLDKNARDGFIREWPVVAMPPERHYGYAVQWFAMASVILILFVGLNTHRVSP